MTESGATRVAVYLDFDNIVISRYDQVHGRNSFQKDKTKELEKDRLQWRPSTSAPSSTSRRRSAHLYSPAPMRTGPPTSTLPTTASSSAARSI